MEKKILWTVDDGDITLVEDKQDAYYQALLIVAREDPDALVMLLSDFLTQENFLQLGKFVNDGISYPIVREFKEV